MALKYGYELLTELLRSLTTKTGSFARPGGGNTLGSTLIPWGVWNLKGDVVFPSPPNETPIYTPVVLLSVCTNELGKIIAKLQKCEKATYEPYPSATSSKSVPGTTIASVGIIGQYCGYSDFQLLKFVRHKICPFVSVFDTICWLLA